MNPPVKAPNRATVLLMFVLLWPAGMGSAAAAAEPIRFAAMGDLPYRQSEREHMPRWLAEISATQPAFIVHVGDFKSAREPCSDETFADRHALFDAAGVPFIYIPGDNEWSDCGQLAAGGFKVLERLEKLRQVFFAGGESLGRQRLRLEKQVAAPEQVRWFMNGVLFLTLNLPGGNNYGPKRLPSAEFLARSPQLIAWLRDGFAQAAKNNAAAVVVAFQANPGFAIHAHGLRSASFADVLQTLRREAETFARPVLVIHGDTHAFRFDQPMRNDHTGKTLFNLWRVEVPGSPLTGWVEISIDTTGDAPPVRAVLRHLK